MSTTQAALSWKVELIARGDGHEPLLVGGELGLQVLIPPGVIFPEPGDSDMMYTEAGWRLAVYRGILDLERAPFEVKPICQPQAFRLLNGSSLDPPTWFAMWFEANVYMLEKLPEEQSRLALLVLDATDVMGEAWVHANVGGG